MSEAVGLVPALKSLDGEAPSGLLDTVNFFLKKARADKLDESVLVEALATPDVNNQARVRFQLLISRWDADSSSSWATKTTAHSADRRLSIYDLLEIGDDSRERLDEVYPRDPGAIVIEGGDGDWDPWYDAGRQSERDFYWNAYSGLLAKSGWNAQALGRLDTATTSVVRRLADPTWSDRYQSKGLVVGYVQSGKTANFTGVLAKAVDAGYRLIIVLTGTVEILRRQTQRRLDMELVGVENILGGIDEADATKVAETDYHQDQDWLDGKFLRHNVPIWTLDDAPTIRRLSTYSGDYKRLKQGLAALDFRAGHELADKQRPLYDPVNLFRSDVRLAIVKKNSTVLKRLVDDLGEIHAELGEIPTLIIDDEADQASVNTKKQRNPTAEEKERTAVNRRIADLLKVLKRAQYVGYTATPFANVFVDPDDSEDIFPKDFIVTLDRPHGYMGASDFHDLDVDFGGEPKTIHNSNEKAFVRDLTSTSADKRVAELQEAIDAFVLTGTIKLYRREPCGEPFRHHTMLVHESVKMADHAALADEIRELWKQAGYDTTVGLQRLQRLFETDVQPVTAALHGRATRTADAVGDPAPAMLPTPQTFEELTAGGWIGKALDLIDAGTSPVIVVNGAAEKDYEQDALDFQTANVWKILVGGAKLSRGFTVEGLTISYYTRRTQQADTLMQMGRWFGFRRGYRDLVRLYIGRNVPGPRTQTIDLYEAFEAVVRDEEDFRAELARYAALNEETGQPQVRPEDVPPMVFQQLPWLKPTASNKMYNAELTTQGVGGQLQDFPRQAEREQGQHNDKHFELVQPLLDRLEDRGQFEYVDPTSNQVRTYDARYGIVDAKVLLEAISGFKWTPNYKFSPHLKFMASAIAEGTLTDFAVLVPTLTGAPEHRIGNRKELFSILKRARRGGGRGGFSGSSFRQRAAVETIAGKRVGSPLTLDTTGGPVAQALHTATRGGLLLTFALDAENPDVKPQDLQQTQDIPSADIASLFSYALPYLSAPSGRIGFKTRKSGAGAIIDRSDL
ncbi:Z1 domain-containing protein [Blastococcus goldschmidtiae]|uniref:Z1 domain-containing protein n=1 Tax=Blastococcus goldschmidtiae TaxID=3075546 RepID=A0ABU2K8Y6_9ACTN|nr:Z1 domain-containing protein [Blastococcus sp. DSM 46792]MDT0276656.1 Z1 domain-containing protein [Blastococcus sp. DSM 46792]